MKKTDTTHIEEFEGVLIPPVINAEHIKYSLQKREVFPCSALRCTDMGACENCMFNADKRNDAGWDRIQRWVESKDWIARYEL